MDKNWRVREAACFGLGQLPKARWGVELTKGVGSLSADPHDRVRRAAARLGAASKAGPPKK